MSIFPSRLEKDHRGGKGERHRNCNRERKTIQSMKDVTVGIDRANLRAAETVGEGARLEQRVLHLPPGDSADSLEYDPGKAFIYRLIGVMLVALLVWFILLVLMMPE